MPQRLLIVLACLIRLPQELFGFCQAVQHPIIGALRNRGLTENFQLTETRKSEPAIADPDDDLSRDLAFPAQDRQPVDFQQLPFRGGICLPPPILISQPCRSCANRGPRIAGQLRLKERIEKSGDVKQWLALRTRSRFREPQGDGPLEVRLQLLPVRDGFDPRARDGQTVYGQPGQEGAAGRGLEVEQGAEQDVFSKAFRRRLHGREDGFRVGRRIGENGVQAFQKPRIAGRQLRRPGAQGGLGLRFRLQRGERGELLLQVGAAEGFELFGMERGRVGERELIAAGHQRPARRTRLPDRGQQIGEDAERGGLQDRPAGRIEPRRVAGVPLDVLLEVVEDEETGLLCGGQKMAQPLPQAEAGLVQEGHGAGLG